MRNLEVGETLPKSLYSGFETLKLEPRWVWVYDDEGIKACLIAAPCHGIVHVLRVCSTPEAPKTAVLMLLRQGIRDVKARGYTGVMVFLEASTEDDMKLSRIAGKFGMVGIKRLGFWCAGKL